MSPAPSPLTRLEALGSAARISGGILSLLPKSRLLRDFSPAEARQLVQFMDAYRCQAGVDVVREGERGDFLLFVVEGRLAVMANSGVRRLPQELAAGGAFGELALIDGEPHEASCAALDASLIAVMTRERLAEIVLDHPALGAKVLMALVGLLAARLRSEQAS